MFFLKYIFAIKGNLEGSPTKIHREGEGNFWIQSGRSPVPVHMHPLTALTHGFYSKLPLLNIFLLWLHCLIFFFPLAGLGHLISCILINGAHYFKRISESGIKKMCRNIFILQQNLTNITMSREADLDFARWAGDPILSSLLFWCPRAGWQLLPKVSPLTVCATGWRQWSWGRRNVNWNIYFPPRWVGDSIEMCSEQHGSSPSAHSGGPTKVSVPGASRWCGSLKT